MTASEWLWWLAVIVVIYLLYQFLFALIDKK